MNKFHEGNMRILGIDYGSKKIGLAFGDTETKIAVPLRVVKNIGEETERVIAQEIIKDGYELVVVGVAQAVGGHTNETQAKISREFFTRLSSLVSVPIVEEDESFTTVESQRLLRDENALADEDALAAMLMVQGYLNRNDRVVEDNHHSTT